MKYEIDMTNKSIRTDTETIQAYADVSKQRGFFFGFLFGTMFGGILMAILT